MFTRRSFLALSSILCLPAVAQAEPEARHEATDTAPPKLLLVPLGNGLKDADVELIRSCLLTFYHFEVVLGQRFALPRTAFYSPRQRYRAEKLLDYLDNLAPKAFARVVGVTGVDISTTKGQVHDFGILGLATIDGRACVLSSHRCQRGTHSRQELLHRFGKVAVHEVGHTLGLEHCPNAGCLMEDAKGSVLTSDREYDLCPNCRAKLKAQGRAARENPAIPWPRPRI